MKGSTAVKDPTSSTPPGKTSQAAAARPARATARAGRPSVLWAFPGLLFFVLFAAAPMVLVVYLSFTDWDNLSDPVWIGWDNWSRIWDDSRMRQAVWLSLLLTFSTWAVQTPLALLLGVWSAGRQKNRAVLSAIFFVPLLASSVATAVVWATLLDPNFGLISDIGPWIGLSDGDLLGSERGAFWAIVFVSAWQFVPFHTLIYQGGARAIPKSLYDAASLDGAGPLRQFFHITLPQLRNTIVTSSILMVVGALTYFDTVLILTEGGPGDATAIVPYLMYETGFQAFDLGYASALATILVLVATAVSLLMVRLTGFAKMRSTREGL